MELRGLQTLDNNLVRAFYFFILHLFAHRGRVLFEVIRCQITSFKLSQAQVYFFIDSYEKCCVYVIMAQHY